MPGMLNLFFVLIWKKEVQRTDDHCIFFDLGSDWDFSNIDFVFNKNVKFDYKKVTRHVFVKHGCPRRQQSRNMAKSLSPKF